MSTTREMLIDAAEQSPRAVKAQDKAAWLDIFAKQYHVEDPVGSKLKVSPEGEANPREPLSRFYDTFMAPNEIVFDVKRDLVCGNHVMRDLTLHVKMAGKLDSFVPMHLLYELVEEEGCYKVSRLEAHWEFEATNKAVLSNGLSALPIMLGMSKSMIKHLGWRGMLAFGASSKTVGEAGKLQVHAFVEALLKREQAALVTLFEHNSEVVHLPYGEPPLNIEQLLHKMQGTITLSKVIAAGNRISASMTLTEQGQSREGVLLFTLNPKTLKILEVFFYVE